MMTPADYLLLIAHKLYGLVSRNLSPMAAATQREVAVRSAKASIRRALTGRDESGRFLPQESRRIAWALAEAELDALGI